MQTWIEHVIGYNKDPLTAIGIGSNIIFISSSYFLVPFVFHTEMA